MIPARWPWHGRDAEDTQPVPVDAEPEPEPEPTPRPGGAYSRWLAASRVDQATADACSCGRATKCDPFAGLPVWPGPDAEWLRRESARVGKLARLTRRHGSRGAALRMFGRSAVMPSGSCSGPP